MNKSQSRLLILSFAFAPSIGGIETVSDLLARILSRRGYDVTVLTSTEGKNEEPNEPFRVIRNPNWYRLISEIRRADIVLQCNISLRIAWPLWLLYIHKPFILVHHGLISQTDGRLGWQHRLKRSLLWRPYCLSVSNYIAEKTETPSQVIRNPYAGEIFRRIPSIERSNELLFVGRLVRAKGVDTLLHAFPIVLKQRPNSTLSVVGEGPEEAALRSLAKSLGIDQRVFFLGSKQGNALAELMNKHQIIVVPSRSEPPEAVGIVPVEGIACGCVPVASKQGGLQESVGSAGILFKEGDYRELGSILLHLLASPELLESYRNEAEAHLKAFQPETVADAYESHFGACRR